MKELTSDCVRTRERRVRENERKRERKRERERERMRDAKVFFFLDQYRIDLQVANTS